MIKSVFKNHPISIHTIHYIGINEFITVVRNNGKSGSYLSHSRDEAIATHISIIKDFQSKMQ